MTNPNYIHVVMVLDESGSMKRVARDLVSTVQDYIERQRALPQTTSLSIYKFSTKVSTVIDGVNVNDANFSGNDYTPKGSTALYDALNKAVDSTGLRLHNMNPGDRPGKVVVFVYTDGEDNASEIDPSVLKDKIKHQEQKYGWEFMFVAAGIDGAEYKKSLQISDANFFRASGSSADMKVSYGILLDRSVI